MKSSINWFKLNCPSVQPTFECWGFYTGTWSKLKTPSNKIKSLSLSCSSFEYIRTKHQSLFLSTFIAWSPEKLIIILFVLFFLYLWNNITWLKKLSNILVKWYYLKEQGEYLLSPWLQSFLMLLDFDSLSFNGHIHDT